MDYKLIDNRLDESGEVREKNKKKVWCHILTLIVVVLGCISMIAIFRAVYDAVEKPTKKPIFPKEYEASITLHMPYNELVEPIYVHVNEKKGLQRLSYYGGMDVYVYNISGTSYQINPVVHEQQCFKTHTNRLQHVFPNLTLYEPESGYALINGISCQSWHYATEGEGPTPEGLMGIYTLYVDASDNRPVRFHYVGHNVMLGGSHLDEYYIDYHFVKSGPVDDELFRTLPKNMDCHKMDGLKTKSMPLNDLHMLFPEGIMEKNRQYDMYQQTHHKTRNESDHHTRWTAFHHSLRYINAVNRQGKTYYLQMNHLADLTEMERNAIIATNHHNGLQRPTYNGAAHEHVVNASDPMPPSVDWRKKGAVTKVKDQGVCGSCYTFGTTGALEGAYYQAKGKLLELSQQNLMDCSWTEGNRGCDGGFDFQCYHWILKNGGIQTTNSYGNYENVDGFCHYNSVHAAVRMKSFVNVTGMDQLNHALATIGPLSISIDATQPSFYFYGGGYYNDLNCKSSIDDLDHSVLAVGYLTHGSQKYTIVKNSWSTHWGTNGYIFISQKENICGVATAATYPLIH